MRPFRFRLEKVLAWRRTELEVEEFKTRQLAAELEGIEQDRHQLLAARTTAEQALLGASRLEGSELEAHDAYLARLSGLDRKLQRRRAEQETKLTAQRTRLTEAQRRCRLLERLRSRREEEWQTEMNRELETFAAETHLARWSPPRS